ncbi:MAG: 3-isopropylmalate dehydratase small subunit [Spirochaetota bacterium]
MKGWKIHEDQIVPLLRNDIDTDQILPKQFMKLVEREGFGKHLFHNWRYLDDAGNIPNPEFIINRKEYSARTILLTGENFGCGSSREHAPWALAQYGFKAILAPSFADIFYGNCAKNGIALIPLAAKTIQCIMETIGKDKEKTVQINLPARKVVFDNKEFSFRMEPHFAQRIINDLDDIELTLRHKDKILKFEKNKLFV